MTWTAPATVTTNQNISATVWNQQIPNNMAEQDAATVTAVGDLAYADAANSMGGRIPAAPFSQFEAATVAGLRSTGSVPAWRLVDGAAHTGTWTSQKDDGAAGSSTSFQLLPSDWYPTPGGEGVTFVGGVEHDGTVLVYFGARWVNSTVLGANVQLSYVVNSFAADEIPAAAARGTLSESDPASTATTAHRVNLHTGLTPGSHTEFQLAALSSNAAATVKINCPYLIVKAL